MPPRLLVAVALLACACGRNGPPPQPEGGDRSATLVKLDHFGYRPRDPKVAVFSLNPGPLVQVRTSAGEVVFSVPDDGGSIVAKGFDAPSGDSVWWVDFSGLARKGRFVLESPSLHARSYEFEVAPDAYDEVLRAAARTFYFQRCGVAKPPRYAGPWSDEKACHRTDASAGPAAGQADHGRRDLSGGWHDAGDYNKYVWRDTASALAFMLRAYEANPLAFPDGGLDIPESGNGLSDLLDEVKWELDFLLAMQLGDGSVLSRLHAEGPGNGSAPPSADAEMRFYHDPSLESGAVFAGSCALGSRVFARAGRPEYAARLKSAALSAWDWLQRQGDSSIKLWAAAEIFRLDEQVLTARRYVDARYGEGQGFVLPSVGDFATLGALTYVQAKGATPLVVAAMRADLGRLADAVFAADDLYRNGMPASSYHWGSNAVRAAQGVFLLEVARLGASGTHRAAECRDHALDMLHYFHGQNPLSMVYLTNMAGIGGEHSAWQVFHHWFGQAGDSYSRSRYVGKPRAVAEPDYPYFKGRDNHGVDDAKVSLLGPAPGFVPGGPNEDYSGDARPPRDGLPNRAYRDSNDQTVWTAKTWEITETSIGYQGPYLALVSSFVAHASKSHVGREPRNPENQGPRGVDGATGSPYH